MQEVYFLQCCIVKYKKFHERNLSPVSLPITFGWSSMLSSVVLAEVGEGNNLGVKNLSFFKF